MKLFAGPGMCNKPKRIVSATPCKSPATPFSHSSVSRVAECKLLIAFVCFTVLSVVQVTHIALQKDPTFAETAETLMERLTASMTIHGHALAAARADRQAQESARRIRADQDSAYLESLRADQAKARQEQAAREQAERERREAEERARREEEERVKAARAVPEEPAEGEAGCTKIVVRLPDGSRLERRFRATDTIGVSFIFHELLD